MATYVLTQQVPMDVEGGRGAYRLRIKSIDGSREWHLVAEFGDQGSYWFLAHHGSEERLLTVLHRSGFDLLPKTVPDSILQQLVRDGRARIVQRKQGTGWGEGFEPSEAF